MSITALAVIPSVLQTLLTKLNAIGINTANPKTRTRLLLSGAALLIVLKYLLGSSASKKRGYVSNLDKVGKRVESGGSDLKGGAEEPEYDIIVIGGGTSGCALAARLSENPNIRVLLLEAGGSGTALSDSSTPAGFGRLLHRPTYVHGLRTELQAAAGGKKKFWPRAKMLGGCSSINAQMAQYGAFGDFDEWATYMGDDSWAWKNFSRYFRKFESYQPHPDYPLVDASARGRDGPMHVGYFNTITEPSKTFVQACVGVGIKHTHDFNGKDNTMGAGRIMTYVDKNYKRVSSESAYLTPQVLAKKNLTVAINATVTRILFDTAKGSRPKAVGVEFGKEKGGKTWKAYAKKEVIVCGGAVHSPHVCPSRNVISRFSVLNLFRSNKQILLLSGLGPAADLKSHSIPPVLDIPGVGQRLVDHPVVDLYFKDKRNASARFLKPTSLNDVRQALSAVIQYKAGFGGPLAMNFGECAAFVRSDDPVLFPETQFPEKLVDSTSAADSPDLELFTTPFAYKEHGLIGFDVHTFALHVYLLRPTSHGTVLLKSANPWEQPSVNPNYLSTPEDLAKLVRGVKLLLQIARTEPLASMLDDTFTRPDLDHETHLRSDADIRALVRERVETVYHPVSTCRMAPQAEGGVVDSSLRVYGVDGLRVCDASIFPWIPSGHTAGACYAIAEKLADEIKSEFNGHD